MKEHNDILDELRSLGSPLADMSRAMPYAVPEGYFSNFEKQLIAEISLEGSNDLLNLSKETPLPVPEGYFEELPAMILALVQEQPKLELPKSNPFEVPAGYFDKLPEQMLQAAKAEGKKKGRVIPFTTHIQKGVKWAAAAMLVAALGIGSYRMLTPAQLTPSEELAKLPADVISDYVSQNIDEFDMEVLESTINNSELQSLTDEEIDKYLEETDWNTTN
ncbi:hypothetical protein [Polluticoccus soli]|uniref:hypothetical protein n=1 Tax=Polluticoccus soli TaxID=3034150 RepID=UPI0023E2E8D3|nr:hypothetical protein [Flavipsychrobacter sp. JY13-12]